MFADVKLRSTRIISVLVAVAIAVLGLAVGPIAPAAAATTNFSYTGAAQTYTVPTGVTSITVSVCGASGGGTVGGDGICINGPLTVTPGQTLNLYVGGAGSTAASVNDTAPGGFNGGGASGQSGIGANKPGSGGGASDIRQGGAALANRVIAAGGGGGGTTTQTPVDRAGGAGGASAGVAGAASLAAGGGKGGTQLAGGAGGTGGNTGSSGSLGNGGAGATSTTRSGGGGGGGFYGGGGGTSGNSAAGAGGGGSSKTPTGGSTGSTNTGNGTISITANTATVTYNGNGSTGGSAPTDPSSPYGVGSSVTVLSAGTLTRANYTFNHWNTAANDSGTSYAPGATFTIGADTTLFAQWTQLSHTVTFDNNGGSGSMGNQSANVATALDANTFTRAGYTFDHWNTAANDSGTSYADQASFPFTADATLYAQWTALPTHTVTFANNGGSGSMGNQVANVATALDANTFTRAGYTFDHWNTAANDSGTSYANRATFPFTSNATLFAQWKSAVVPKRVQVPLHKCVTPGSSANSIPRRGSKRLMKPGCVTNAGKTVGVKVRAAARTRGDAVFYRLYCKVGAHKARGVSKNRSGFYCSKGSLRIRTYGYKLRLQITWSAPATARYLTYKTVKHYRT